jgi:hypothetical protein
MTCARRPCFPTIVSTAAIVARVSHIPKVLLKATRTETRSGPADITTIVPVVIVACVETASPAHVLVYAAHVLRTPVHLRQGRILCQQRLGQRIVAAGVHGVSARVGVHARSHHHAWCLHDHALRVRLLHPLLVPLPLALQHFLVKKGFDANTSGFGAEMATQGVGAGEPTAAAPLASALEIALADELLLTRVQAFVALAVMLASKGFPAHRAYEGPLVRVRPEMRPEIIGSGESLGA